MVVSQFQFNTAWLRKQQFVALLHGKNKKPTDLNQRAKNIVDIATGEIEDNLKEKDLIKLAASAMGRKGGLKGGKATWRRNYLLKDALK